MKINVEIDLHEGIDKRDVDALEALLGVLKEQEDAVTVTTAAPAPKVAAKEPDPEPDPEPEEDLVGDDEDLEALYQSAVDRTNELVNANKAASAKKALAALGVKKVGDMKGNADQIRKYLAATA